MAKKAITVRLFIGDKQIDTLTDEQRSEVARRFSEVLGYHYTAHPDEFAALDEEDEKQK